MGATLTLAQRGWGWIGSGPQVAFPAVIGLARRLWGWLGLGAEIPPPPPVTKGVSRSEIMPLDVLTVALPLPVAVTTLDVPPATAAVGLALDIVASPLKEARHAAATKDAVTALGVPRAVTILRP